MSGPPPFFEGPCAPVYDRRHSTKADPPAGDPLFSFQDTEDAPISATKDLRINYQIRARQVRLVGDTGEQLGIMDTREALTMAQNKGLDLVEVAPDGVPPVCRIMNYGKFKYSQRKREKEAAKKQRVIKVKEIKIRPKIDEHDYQIKMRQAWEFLDHGDKVKVTLVFRGREMSHKDIGRMLMDRVVQDLAEIAEPDAMPKDEGPVIIAVFTAKPHRPQQGEKEGKNAQAEDK